jgi:hypothetical protein
MRGASIEERVMRRKKPAAPIRERAPKFDPAADLAARFIEEIELDALALHTDTRMLGVRITKHLSTWFEEWPHKAPSLRAQRHRSPVRQQVKQARYSV